MVLSFSSAATSSRSTPSGPGLGARSSLKNEGITVDLTRHDEGTLTPFSELFVTVTRCFVSSDS